MLIVANVVNIGVDLGGIAEATGMMTGISQYIRTPIYAAVIISLLPVKTVGAGLKSTSYCYRYSFA